MEVAAESATTGQRKDGDGERLEGENGRAGAAINGRGGGGGGGEALAALKGNERATGQQKAPKEEEEEEKVEAKEAKGGQNREGDVLASSPLSPPPPPPPSEGGVFFEPMRHLPLVCNHGGLHPSSVAGLKLVTRAVYEGLLGEEGMPPPDRHLAASNFYCGVCVDDHIRRK